MGDDTTRRGNKERKRGRSEAEREGETVRNAVVGGTRGTAGAINTLNVNHRHLAGGEGGGDYNVRHKES